MPLIRPLSRPLPRSIARGLTEAGSGGGASFSPADRFTGINGFWYAPNDLSTLFQDAAGTVPVTATGQTVKRVNDKSGNGRHVSNAAANWTLQNDGTNNYLLTDGATRLNSSSFAWGTDELSFFSALKPTTGGQSIELLSFGAFSSQTGSFELGYASGGLYAYRRGTGTVGGRFTANLGTTATVFSTVLDLAGTTHETQNPYLRVNGVQPSLSPVASANAGQGNFGTYVLTLGGRTVFYTGRLYETFAFAQISTLEEIEAAESYVGSKSGITLPFNLAPAPDFGATGAEVSESGYIRTSPFATAAYDTSATDMYVSVYSDVQPSFPTVCQLGYRVDNGPVVGLLPTISGPSTIRLTLPAGAKRLTFINGLQSSPSQSAVLGTYFVGATANAAMTAVAAVSPPAGTVVYGDSIAVGADATLPVGEGWALVLRDAIGAVSVEGYGYRSLYLDAFDGTARAAFVAKIVAYAPARIWLAIGTNDYGLSKWGAASFGTAYAALLDDLHTALPSAVIYAQTPLVRTTETANAFGSTLGDYRSQISTAVSTRTAYTTLVDGTAILTTGDLADGVHPTTAGHALYAAYVEGVLGI